MLLISSTLSQHRLSVIHRLLLVQLIGPLLEFLLAGWLAQVLGDHRAGVGVVVLKGSGAATGGLGVDVVDGVRRGVGVGGFLCDLVGDA